MSKGWALVCASLVLAGCVATSEDTASRLAQDALIVDTHIDVPFRLYRQPADISQATEDGDFDYPRAKAGGLDALFMSIYIPASIDAEGFAGPIADELIEMVEAIANDAPDKFAIAHCADDVDRIKASGRIAFPLGMENGGPIAGSFAELEAYFELGIRYVTLAHSKSNHISDSSYDTDERWQGLSPFGKTLIPEMNRLGVMVDISHLSDRAAWQVLELTRTPVMASHSSLRHFTPGWHRNMDDDLVRAVGRNKGVVQINYGSSFLTQEARSWSDDATQAREAFMADNGITEWTDPRLVDYRSQYRIDNPYPFADIEDVLDHIDRAVSLAGIDHVGLGSDFDGVGDTLPTGLKDASTYPNLVAGLQRRGYDEAGIRKILGGNVMRVWRANESYAAAQGTQVRCAL